MPQSRSRTAGFTALTEAHGDVLAADIAERLVSVTKSVAAYGDRLVKNIGDAVLLTSTDAASAIRLVLRLFDAYNKRSSGIRSLPTALRGRRMLSQMDMPIPYVKTVG